MLTSDHGFYEGTALADKIFHGFRLTHVDGNLSIDIIDDGTTVVELPQDDIIDPNAYKHWFWSASTISYRWGNNGHLLMEML